MRKNKSLIIFSLLLFSSINISLISCNNDASLSESEKLNISGENIVYVGNTYQYTTNKDNVKFSVNDESIALISNKGSLTVLKSGKITVFASNETESAQIEVSVFPYKGYTSYELEIASLPNKVSYNTGDYFDSTGLKINLLTYVDGAFSSKGETKNYSTNYESKQFTKAGDVEIAISYLNTNVDVNSISFTVNVNDTFKPLKDQINLLTSLTNYTLEFKFNDFIYVSKYTDTAYSNGVFNANHEYIDINDENPTTNNVAFINDDGILSASFYKEDGVIKHSVNSDYYVDIETGKRYVASSVYEIPSFDFRPKVDNEELNNTMFSNDTYYGFSALTFSTFFNKIGFTNDDISGLNLYSKKTLDKETHTYMISNDIYLKVYDINNTKIDELTNNKDSLKGVNQLTHLVDFMNYIKLDNENSFTIEDFPNIDNTYNYYLNTDSKSDSNCTIIGTALNNPLPDFKEKMEKLSYTLTLKLDDYYGLSINQYLSKDNVWLFSLMYDESNQTVSFGVFYYQGSFDSYLDKEKFNQLIEKRLGLASYGFMDEIYDKLDFFSNRTISSEVLSKVSYRQLKSKEGNSLLQIETDVLDEKSAKIATKNIESYLEMNSFAKEEIVDEDENISYVYSKTINDKLINVEVGYYLDSSTTIPTYKTVVLFYD